MDEWHLDTSFEKTRVIGSGYHAILLQTLAVTIASHVINDMHQPNGHVTVLARDGVACMAVVQHPIDDNAQTMMGR